MGGAADYPRFSRINGCHPYKTAVPGGCVEYQARRRPGGQVVYFNFDLAREMGLIPTRHPARLNKRLRRAILATFSLTIVNEYDLMNGIRVPARDRLPNTYMATRYLQIQHPDRRGATSGDGRSIWNGTLTHRGITWDVSSCGTGVTRLCPATAEHHRFFKTGNWSTNYGCGTATMHEGLETLLMSETFHRQGIPTERILALITLPDGFAINVRAGRNLIRPSHFFLYLKQGRRNALQAAVDYFMDRQVRNGVYPRIQNREKRYRFLASTMADIFARTAALFESEYIFCWIDWDGDNILADGGIIDYGSVRQFGLCHREYRFDDGPRSSTSLPEQRRKARYLVQTFAQIRDFLITGRKAPLATFSRDPVLTRFDAEFARARNLRLLHNMGLPPRCHEKVLRRALPAVERFRHVHRTFERARSSRGPRKVSDGLTWNAVYSTRDILRELPLHLMEKHRPLEARTFLSIALSTYASKADRRLTLYRQRMAGEFQRAYLRLIETAARETGDSARSLLEEVARRSAAINRRARITGDSITLAASALTQSFRQLTSLQFHRVIDRFLGHQILIPGPRPPATVELSDRSGPGRIVRKLMDLQDDFRHGL
ncbi:MAG: hypothetical protein ACE5HD_12635 [Acidobacteriota bacterium]